jgi:PAS domain S-box-containing protein
MTNKVAHTLFGYNKTELRGKNISMLLPAVVAESHTSYIRNFITTGMCSSMMAVLKGRPWHCLDQ